MKSFSNDIVNSDTLTKVNIEQDKKIDNLQKQVDKLKLFGGLVLVNILAIYSLIVVYFPM
jgi:hypothetical protein